MPDLINGAFELFGGVFILLNILQLLRDKQVKGIHWGSSIFFTSWGLWNCWYYPHLGQWASFAGGVVICLLNVVWLWLRIRYFTLGKPVRVFCIDWWGYVKLRLLWQGKRVCWVCGPDGCGLPWTEATADLTSLPAHPGPEATTPAVDWVRLDRQRTARPPAELYPCADDHD